MTNTLRTDDDAVSEWVVCPGCDEMIYVRRLTRNLSVCPECGEHQRLSAGERIDQLFDAGRFEVLPISAHSRDILGFIDTVAYPTRLAAARAATGLDEGILVVRGTIGGQQLVAAVMDFNFLGGSLGSATGEVLTQAAELALVERVPLLIVCASGGARMQEGAVSLMQMAKTSQALGQLDKAGVLTISLVTDPTYGGVAASFATLCDVIIAEPAARLGFAGRRVIEQTIRQELPPGFQTAEFLLERGLIDMICRREHLRGTLTRLLTAGNSWRTPPVAASALQQPDIVRDPAELPEVDPWQAVQQARELGRPTVVDYLNRAFDEFEELRGDRIGGECSSILGGIARLQGRSVVVIGHRKGSTIAELVTHNYGMPTPSGYRKAVRLMNLAAKLGLPVVTFVDTPGAYPGIEAEEQGQAIAIAESIRLMAGLPVPIVTLVTGEGGSGGALALAVADEVLICQRGVYSVISPEGCASILWKSPAKAPLAAAALRLDARALLEQGIVDGVIVEPPKGNASDHDLAARRIKSALVETLARLSALNSHTLLANRHRRFRSFGTAPAMTAVSGGATT